LVSTRDDSQAFVGSTSSTGAAGFSFFSSFFLGWSFVGFLSSLLLFFFVSFLPSSFLSSPFGFFSKTTLKLGYIPFLQKYGLPNDLA
jgi:hypothetical protein|tara:strand:+ start:576 stop:836 length:261 start_codon:yes stop_codon:yes gene_type:complete